MSRELEAARRARDGLFLAACWDGDDAIVEEALTVGVAPNCCDKDGVTGLMKAITRANQEVVDLLLQHPKTDVNQRSGRAALTVGVRGTRWWTNKQNITYNLKPTSRSTSPVPRETLVQ